ncbi:hypothetical protein ACO2I3_19210 [Leptospira interrogans]
MSLARKLFRLRFCECQTFAITLPAASPSDAIQRAQFIRDNDSTVPFDGITGGSDDWQAEPADLEGGAE